MASETRERSALEVLRRFNQLVDERHLVVMGPQDLTDPLWDDIEALLGPTPASDGGEVGVKDRLTTPATYQDSLQVDDGD